jgi:hypothetical protein
MQTGSSGTLIGWKSGQTTFVPLWDRMEGAWLRTRVQQRSLYSSVDNSTEGAAHFDSIVHKMCSSSIFVPPTFCTLRVTNTGRTEKERQLADGRRGEEPNLTTGERLVLYKAFILSALNPTLFPT